MQPDLSHKTAIARTKPSAPLKYLEERGLLDTHLDLLDYGCGRGFDADYYGMDKYDPHYFPNIDRSKKYDMIFCTYVLNVVDISTEFDIIMDINSLLKLGGIARFTVRRDMPINGRIFNGYRQRFSDPILNPKLVEKGYTAYFFYSYQKTKQWAMFEMRKFPTNKSIEETGQVGIKFNSNSSIPSNQTYTVSSGLNSGHFTISETSRTDGAVTFRITPTQGVYFNPGDVIRIDNLG